MITIPNKVKHSQTPMALALKKAAENIALHSHQNRCAVSAFKSGRASRSDRSVSLHRERGMDATQRRRWAFVLLVFYLKIVHVTPHVTPIFYVKVKAAHMAMPYISDHLALPAAVQDADTVILKASTAFPELDRL